MTVPYRRVNWGVGQDVAERVALAYQPLLSSYVEVVPDRQGWLVEVPAVLWMLERLAAGGLTPAVARANLLGMTAWRSECCYGCDELPQDWLHRQLAARQEWEGSHDAVTSETHPYLVNGAGTVVHRWDCVTVVVEPPLVVTDRHTYAMIGCGPVTSRHRGPRRVTAPEVRAWVERGRVPALCGVCGPVLPVLGDAGGEAIPTGTTRLA